MLRRSWPNAAAGIAARGCSFHPGGDVRRHWLWRQRGFFRASRTYRGGDRHQRQDLGRRLYPPDLGRPRRSAASIGTVGLVSPTKRNLRLAHHAGSGCAAPLLHDLAGQGITHLALEASSHGLDQHRLDGLAYRGWSLHQSEPRPSRLSPELGRLFRCQARLFDGPDWAAGTAVITRRSRAFRGRDAVAKQRRLRLLTVGRKPEAFA